MCTGLYLYLRVTWFGSDRFRGHGDSVSQYLQIKMNRNTLSTFGDETRGLMDIAFRNVFPDPCYLFSGTQLHVPKFSYHFQHTYRYEHVNWSDLIVLT
jgi:hypothetical protein